MNNHLPEVEAKILDTTEAKMRDKILSLGFSYHLTYNLKAQWLINPANGEKLRVRQENDIVMVEHKAPVVGASDQIKSLQETGFEARDFEAVIATLCLVGLEKVGFPSVKKRVSYVLDMHANKRVRLDFDTYSELMGKPIPEFLEIEATTEETVYLTAKALGFLETDCQNF